MKSKATLLAALVAPLLSCSGSDSSGDQAGGSGGASGSAGASGGGGTTADASWDGGDPLNASPVCTSGTTWDGFLQSLVMAPGRSCIACHEKTAWAPVFTIAGTVYPTGHEPDDCNGADGENGAFAGAAVVITDAANNVLDTLPVNTVGTFTYQEPVAQPFFAKVTLGTKQREMLTSPPNGDCNGCHTQAGENGAPGRITLPAP